MDDMYYKEIFSDLANKNNQAVTKNVWEMAAKICREAYLYSLGENSYLYVADLEKVFLSMAEKDEG